MRRPLAIVAALLLAGPALGADCTWASISGAARSKVATGAVNCTFTEASAAATDGMWLDSVGAFAVEVCADSGETITTSFSLNAYVYNPYSLLWSPATSWNLPAPSAGTGEQCQYVGGFTVPSPVGRVAFAPSAGAVSSGGITIRLTATQIGRYDGQVQL